ncbi:Isoleucyl-tRNA synthetase [Gammaproteobacteria bacterium]
MIGAIFQKKHDVLDFNSSSAFPDRLASLIDVGNIIRRKKAVSRQYLGASQLGASCERAIQYGYTKTPVDPGRETSGQTLRIFERGHLIETKMATWLRRAGFKLRTHNRQREQIGFSTLEGQFQGHIDGIITKGPDLLEYPCLWENKCLGAKYWREIASKGLAIARPEYAAQIALYQAYLELYQHPALFTAVNADTMEIYAERVPFDADLAQRTSDRAVKIITATRAGETLPRSFAGQDHFECRMCQWQNRCWRAS